MKVFTVHIRRHALDPARDLAAVKEGFNWAAFLFNGLWAMWHRMWLAALAMFAFGGVIEGFLTVFDADDLTRAAARLAYAVIIGLIANDVRRRALERRGFVFVGLGLGDSPDDALGGFLATAEPALVQL